MAEEFLNKAGTQALIDKIKSDFAKKADVYTKAETDTAINAAVSGAFHYEGTKAFADLPALSGVKVGEMYNVSDDFTTTADFVEGAGKKYAAGTNVAGVNTGTDDAPVMRWDVLGSTLDLTTLWAKTELTAIPTADVEAMFD